jgi:hypothetical protein
MRLVSVGNAYLAQDDSTLHFGLGPTKAYERLEVVWPGGRVQTVAGGATNRTVEVTQATP